MNPGMTTGMNPYGQQMYPPHHLLSSIQKQCTTLVEDVCTEVPNCRWNGKNCELNLEADEFSPNVNDIDTNGFHLEDSQTLLKYIIIPVCVATMMITLLGLICRSASFGRSQKREVRYPNEPILLDNQIVPIDV